MALKLQYIRMWIAINNYSYLRKYYIETELPISKEKDPAPNVINAV